jgi:hypothetical protein
LVFKNSDGKISLEELADFLFEDEGEGQNTAFEFEPGIVYDRARQVSGLLFIFSKKTYFIDRMAS